MTSQEPAGLRSRIVQPTPPAPVPVPRAQPEPEPTPAEPDKSHLQGENYVPASADASAENSEGTSDADVVRAGGSMAIATLISRITGFLRTVLISSTLGAAIASAFQTANQIPNLVTEIVLGAVLTSLVVPVLVRAEKEDPDRGEEFVRRLFTLAASLLGVVTILSVVGAPLLTRMMIKSDGMVNVDQATSMAYLLLPQIFFYGLFALFQAILNTKNIFAPGAWAPVINNVISIAVLLAYWFLPGELNPAAPSPVTDPHILLLGLGTTAGVVIQCLILIPYLHRAGINLTPLWGIDARLKQFGSMAIAIIAYVAISQAGYVVTSQIASISSEAANVIYQNHWLLLQVPYGVIGVTLLTAIMPRLSRNAADGDSDAVVRDLTLGTKLTFIALIPIVVFFTGFGVPIAQGLFGYGRFTMDEAEILGLTLSFSAFTLIPYALVLLHLRVFYAREEAWTPTFIIAGITITKVVLSLLAVRVASSPDNVVVLLGTANGFGFVAGAVIGAFLLKRHLGSLGGREVTSTTVWSAGAGVVGLLVALAFNWLLDFVIPEVPSLFILVRVSLSGIVFLIVTGLVLSRSGLPEVLNLGRALQRVPGMSRFINIKPDAGIQVEQPEQAEIQPLVAFDAFNSSPVPPPMSAGIVRGPALVPGAPVSDGRFRLLKEHGSVPGARFWQAREQETGRMVALTFVDTTNRAPLAAATPAEVAKRSAEVARSTRKLAEMNLPTVADNIEILSYRNGGLVVADWIEGTELKAVAEAGNLDSRAVAHALAPVLADAAAAHAAGLAYGVDNRARFRVATDGVVRLAFPGVLNNASEESDHAALTSAISTLAHAASPAPQALIDLGESEAPLALIADQLREFGGDAEDAPEEEPLPIAEPEVIVEDEEPGFGSRGYSRSGVFLLGTLATAFVVGMAALTVWIISLIGGDEPETPVTLSAPTTTAVSGPALVLTPAGAVDVASGKETTALTDDSSKTTWTTSKADTGVLLELSQPSQLRDVVFSQSKSTGAEYRVFGVTGTPDPTSLDAEAKELTELASGKLKSAKDHVDLDELPEEFDGVLIWFDSLPKADKVTLTDVLVTGRP
ncbi:murein biosynthesis integral membrane protein MurJ [Corynebacterium phoceense]|uniref:murein biosynthesis integral membrane protein MurJ n=1 Tax=Corynebacterium phoceense TaxID=1686286 RepID=UPI00211CB06A|nr:murein biosynthesis integral membrane protein MurJ [Corynebacterium phoceense]MCQ9340478.1 murein biosynthesis integral membrane protein MurJ [Corynebacterium phoceense]